MKMSQFKAEISCSRAKDLIEAYLDGDLPADASASVARHLDGCPECARQRELAAAVREELKRLPQFDLSPGRLDAIRHRVAGPGPQSLEWPRFRGNRRGAAVLAAAAVACLALAAVLLDTPGSRIEPSPDQVRADRASAEARLAFALIADATRRAEGELIDGVFHERVLATAVRGLSRTIRFSNGGAAETAPPPDREPTPDEGGMT
jgi:anti-sigma factor (TIGR02949 family)